MAAGAFRVRSRSVEVFAQDARHVLRVLSTRQARAMQTCSLKPGGTAWRSSAKCVTMLAAISNCRAP
jgi:hypothetical protein